VENREEGGEEKDGFGDGVGEYSSSFSGVVGQIHGTDRAGSQKFRENK
jgi:hypothetical protein